MIEIRILATLTAILQCSKVAPRQTPEVRWHPQPGATYVMQTEHATPPTSLVTVPNQRASDTGAVHSFRLAGHALIEDGQQVSAEILAFWQSRLKDAVATGRRLLECTSAQNAWEIQLEYAQSAIQAYVDQSNKVTRLVAHTLTDSLLPKAPGAPGHSTTVLAA
jgi:hypothetical protein